ncbi:hypothetical protein KUV50_00155 [Membranicola marinus]|uniref:PAP2 superfamily protein n=1 Tax=Membranihabitans marinus TaxID=1227546 RepID=A0A953HQI3_9BACT|nr:hypothetical protein [Membranihabitans marinus]MBY5956525.1 hypothetical protein [Membranihabitans marinus]
MNNKLAHIVSIIFHPLWFPFGMLLIYLHSNPFVFGISTPFDDMILVLQTLITCIILPLIAVVMMWKINLISSLDMDHRMERIGPFIAMMVFLIWYYLNIDQYGVAPIYRLYILGSIITLVLTFVINLFIKVSLHTAGMGGVLLNLLIAKNAFGYTSLSISFGQSNYLWSYQIILFIALLILFIVLLSRYYLKKHTLTELFGGLILGFLGQILAMGLIDVI